MKVYITTNHTTSVCHITTDCDRLDDSANVYQKEVEHLKYYRMCRACKDEDLGRADAFEESVCDACGETYRQLAAHILHCPEQ